MIICTPWIFIEDCIRNPSGLLELAWVCARPRTGERLHPSRTLPVPSHWSAISAGWGELLRQIKKKIIKRQCTPQLQPVHPAAVWHPAQECWTVSYLRLWLSSTHPSNRAIKTTACPHCAVLYCGMRKIDLRNISLWANMKNQQTGRHRCHVHILF